ncbi:MAG: hypothetical protein ACFE9S_02645 [Candidatus Hermodarchaeota archaeon]
MREDILNKVCMVCKRSISFSEFVRDNPSISELRARDLWNDSMVAIFCPECYFNLPERPFRIKRSYFNYHGKYRNFNKY